MESKFTKNFSEEEIKIRTERLQQAREKFALERGQNTEENEQILLKILERYQKLTLKQINEIFNKGEKKGIFERSFLLNALKRLEDNGLIFSRTSKDVIHGKIIKYYFFKFSKDQDESEIIIPKYSRLNSFLNNPTAYAVSNDTIVIGNNDDKDLISSSTFNHKIENINSTKDIVKIKLPKSFIDFYDLKNNKFYFEKIPTEKTLILKKIRIMKSNSDLIQNKKSKNILLLEDHQAYGTALEKKLTQCGYNVTLVNNKNEFLNILKDQGKTFDIISLDKKIGSENVAKELSIEIKYTAPQAKVGLISATLDEDERQEFQDLGFDFILPKRKKTDKAKLETGFSEIGEELASWAEAI